MRPRIRIKAISRFVATPDESATVAAVPPEPAAVADYSACGSRTAPSDDFAVGLSGAPMQDRPLTLSPGESFPDLPAFLKRERDNVAPYARAA